MNPDIYQPKNSPEKPQEHHEDNDVTNSSKEIYVPGKELTPEVPQPESKPEKELRDPERDKQVQSQQQDQIGAPVLPPIQQAPIADDNSLPAKDSSDDSPDIADDVDVIEKTWVDKAKQIINETKGDPYQQEARVEKLQQSYLKKRYGKEIESSS